MNKITVVETHKSDHMPRRIFTAYQDVNGHRQQVGQIIVQAHAPRQRVNDLHTHGEVFSLTVTGTDPHIGYDLVDAAADALDGPLCLHPTQTYTDAERKYLRHLPTSDLIPA